MLEIGYLKTALNKLKYLSINKGVNMENAKWNKLTTRHLNSEEKEVYGNRFDIMWDGKEPELDEEVLVYTNKSKGVYTDIWTASGYTVGFENTYDTVIYWMSFPKPPKVGKK